MLGPLGCLIWVGYVLGELTGLWSYLAARYGGLSRGTRP